MIPAGCDSRGPQARAAYEDCPALSIRGRDGDGGEEGPFWVKIALPPLYPPLQPRKNVALAGMADPRVWTAGQGSSLTHEKVHLSSQGKMVILTSCPEQKRKAPPLRAGRTKRACMYCTRRPCQGQWRGKKTDRGIPAACRQNGKAGFCKTGCSEIRTGTANRPRKDERKKCGPRKEAHKRTRKGNGQTALLPACAVISASPA